MLHLTSGIWGRELTVLTFPIPKEGQGQKYHLDAFVLCKSIQHMSACTSPASLVAQQLLQPGRHLPSPQAAGPSPDHSSRDSKPPYDSWLVACVKPGGLVQVLVGRYPCVSVQLPVRRSLSGCQARAGWGPLRSAGREAHGHLPRGEMLGSKSGTLC